MKITFPNTNKIVSFNCIAVGNTFRQGTKVYMKIAGVSIEGISILQMLNAVCLNNGRLVYFPNDIQVAPLNAELIARHEDIS